MFLPAGLAEPIAIDAVVIHPLFRESFSCSEHWEGNLKGLGDELGSDCVIQQMVEADGRRWMRAYRGDGLANEDWFAWGQPVLAPCDCEVVQMRENPVVNLPGQMGKPPAAWVQFRRTDGVNVLLAHVVDVSVRPGELVRAGQPIAKVGNNGMSRHPHIHVAAWRGEQPLQIRFDLRAAGRLRADD